VDTWTLTTTFELWGIIDQWQLDETNCYSHVILGCVTILEFMVAFMDDSAIICIQTR
jgi:hypothetical protein